MNNKTLSLLIQKNKTIENVLCELFSWSKRFYKDQKFPKIWSDELVSKNLELSIPIECLNHGKIAPASIINNSKVEILEENSWVAALYKSENIHSHPLGYLEENNVLSILRSKGRTDLLNINISNYDRSLLYRLDFETSGLLLAAKTEEVYQTIRKNFHTIMLKKIYRAKCHGSFKKLEGTWKHFLKPKGVKGATVHCDLRASTDATPVSLNWKVLNFDEKNNVSEVEIELHQGYRHQIRAQFAYEGHALIGDKLYGAAPSDRLYLHAVQYELNLFNQHMIFRSPMPKNW